MTGTFPMRRRWWSRPLALFTRAPLEARVGDGMVHVSLGWIGSAEVPVARIARVGTMDWPWWGGVGARIGRDGLIAFVAAPGPLALLELSDPVEVRAPFRWTARRIGVGAEDVPAFALAVRDARLEADLASGPERR